VSLLLIKIGVNESAALGAGAVTALGEAIKGLKFEAGIGRIPVEEVQAVEALGIRCL